MRQAGVEAFDFYPDKIVGSDTVTNNTKKGFSLKLGKPTLNWELDIETFGLLPLANNKTFAINFYHPGSKSAEPAAYQYKVIGEETLKGIDGSTIPCWKIKIDYSRFAPDSWAVFYIGKKSKEMVKMEEQFGAGVRYKVKLPSSINIF